MSWVRVDDKFPDHPKVIAAGPLAKALYVDALCYCNRLLTDGFIPDRMARRLADDYLEYSAENLLDRLVSVGLWDREEGGYRVHGYLDYQPSAEKVKAEQAANAKRQADWREQQKERRNANSNAVTNGVRNAKSNGPVTGAPTPITNQELTPSETPVAPTGLTSKPTEKTRTERQKASDALYERKMAIVAAYFRGLGIEEGTLPWNQRKAQALGCLTTAILDSPECVPEIIEPLTRYTRSAFQWRNGKKTPQLSEVLAAFAEWDADGRPDGIAKTIRPPVPIASKPQLPPVMQPGNVPKDGGLAAWRNAGNSGG